MKVSGSEGCAWLIAAWRHADVEPATARSVAPLSSSSRSPPRSRRASAAISLDLVQLDEVGRRQRRAGGDYLAQGERLGSPVRIGVVVDDDVEAPSSRPPWRDAPGRRRRCRRPGVVTCRQQDPPWTRSSGRTCFGELVAAASNRDFIGQRVERPRSVQTGAGQADGSDDVTSDDAMSLGNRRFLVHEPYQNRHQEQVREDGWSQ